LIFGNKLVGNSAAKQPVPAVPDAPDSRAVPLLGMNSK